MKIEKVSILFLVLYFAGIKSAVGWVEPEDNRNDPSLYHVGVGIYDATGPAYGVNMMGYANPSQISRGIHIRLYSRAFIIGDGIRRIVFVSVDCGMMGTLLKIKLIEKLNKRFPGGTYSDENLILSGTHSHSGPAGYQQYVLYDITSLGFIQEAFDALLEGMYQSIVRAHNNMKKGYIYANIGELPDASANRSPYSYDHNPEEEKAKYEYNVDKTMTILRIIDVDGNNLGMINWYATHGTSMNNTNPLLSGDNKGYASQLFEYWLNGGALPGSGPFVAAFAQANCGDASPNTDGAKCQDTGKHCQMENSTCNGRSQLCYASGPGKDMMESTKIIGEKQFEKAWELYFDTSNQVKLSGPVQYRMQYVEMANFTFPHPNGEYVTTCEPTLGYSFAAGTTDGPGAFDFTQGMTEGNPFWNTIVGSIRAPRPEVQKCQNPKPILLDTGNYNYPYPWHPRIVDTQIGRIGKFFIVAVPGEFTSMAGRRLKDKIVQKASDHGLHDSIAVIAGLSNVYSHYITTFQEYQVQRYEGASTLFGPNTHEAYMYQYAYLLESMAIGSTLDKGPLPPDLLDEQFCFLPRHHYDTTYKNKQFGSVISQPYPYIYKGETQVAVFVAGNPRNDVRLGDTFLTVERKVNNSYWEIIATDASWETRFFFDTTSKLLGTGEATVYWDIPLDTQSGTYRIKHFGNVTLFSTGKKDGYEGVTQEFIVSDTSSSSRFEPKENFRAPIYTDPFGWVKHYFG